MVTGQNDSRISNHAEDECDRKINFIRSLFQIREVVSRLIVFTFSPFYSKFLKGNPFQEIIYFNSC